MADGRRHAWLLLLMNDADRPGRMVKDRQAPRTPYLARRGAHYLLIIKRNQPGMHAQLAALPWRDIPEAYDKREHGHGRTEAP